MGRALHILVAEDLEDTRILLRALLEIKGHTVTEAANGEEAVDAARRYQPDLILMDVQMPVLDGIEAVRALRQIPSTRNIPILILTAAADGPWRASPWPRAALPS